MAKIELCRYTDEIGNHSYHVCVDGIQVDHPDTSNYTTALNWYKYAVAHNGQTEYEVLACEDVEDDGSPVADETYDWDSPSFVAKASAVKEDSDAYVKQEALIPPEYPESKLWREWVDLPKWAATQSFQEFVESKTAAEREEYERTRNSGHSGSEGTNSYSYVDMSFGAMANRMNDQEFLIFVTDCCKAKQRNKLGKFLSAFVDQFYNEGKEADEASANALYTAVLNVDPPF